MQFVYFLINGIVLGVLTYFSQFLLNEILKNSFVHHQLIASILTITPFIGLNFLSQKKIIFRKHGSIKRFLISSCFIMFLVSGTTEIFSQYNLFIFDLNEKEVNLNFIFAAGIFAPISFYLKKKFVFRL